MHVAYNNFKFISVCAIMTVTMQVCVYIILSDIYYK